MKIAFEITDNDVNKVNEIYEMQKENAFVQHRIKRNLNREGVNLNKDIFWNAIVICLLTTQQKSGPNSAISVFFHEDPFPLSLDICLKQKKLNSFVEQALTKRKGIRFPTKIGNELEYNINILEKTNWQIFDLIIKHYNSKENQLQERKLSEKIDDLLKGFGPKQSRNLLQILGVSKFEIPIDSRITKWLNEFGFPLKLSSNALADKNYYNFIMDGIIILCQKAKLYPCIFDAVIFASFDPDWNEENQIF